MATKFSANHLFKTSDVGLASYLIKEGMLFVNWTLIENTVCFFFDDQCEKCENLQIEYISGSYKVFLSIVEDLKRMTKEL